MGRIAYRFNIDFKDICSNCRDNCCRRFYAVLLPEEEELFRDYSFEVETGIGRVSCIGSRDGKPCPYLDDRGFCSVYEHRPLDCRLWPVMIYVDFKTGERVVYLDLDCPAVREGRVSIDFVKEILRRLVDVDFDEEWLRKYTLAPWPNNLIEVTRYKTREDISRQLAEEGS